MLLNRLSTRVGRRGVAIAASRLLSTCTSRLSTSTDAIPPPTSPRNYPPQQRSRTPSFDVEVAQLATRPLHPLTLTDLVRFGRPPLSSSELLSSAEFTLRVLPIRIARRLLSLRNLPYIVVSNPHISSIYNNYLHSLRLLLSFPQSEFPQNLKEEARFSDVLSEIVDTHRNTIPTLARGFIECRRYISPEQTTAFLEEHLRARIGTRLLAEQHLGLHTASVADSKGRPATRDENDSYIGTIDTALNPATIINSAAEFVGDICDLRYGVRPRVEIDGMPNVSFAYVPVHLEYIMTELLKNAFRATVENNTTDIPVRVTIASTKTIAGLDAGAAGMSKPSTTMTQGDGIAGMYHDPTSVPALEKIESEAARAVTIRIRDRGGGISPENLPRIFSYSFTTFNANSSDDDGGKSGGGGMDAISSTLGDLENSTIAGLGFGMGLSRSYAQFFGGDLKVESLWGWGTDVYLGLRGLSVDDR